MGQQHSTPKTTQRKEPKVSAVSKVPENQPLKGAFVEMSWRIALPFMLFSLGGIELDRRLAKEPLFSIIGLLMALLAVSIVVIKYVNVKFPGTFGGKK